MHGAPCGGKPQHIVCSLLRNPIYVTPEYIGGKTLCIPCPSPCSAHPRNPIVHLRKHAQHPQCQIKVEIYVYPPTKS